MNQTTAAPSDPRPVSPPDLHFVDDLGCLLEPLLKAIRDAGFYHLTQNGQVACEKEGPLTLKLTLRGSVIGHYCFYPQKAHYTPKGGEAQEFAHDSAIAHLRDNFARLPTGNHTR